jgi:hypothetical protein
VTFIDDKGKDLLAEMYQHGTELVAEGCMNKAIVEEITREGQGGRRNYGAWIHGVKYAAEHGSINVHEKITSLFEPDVLSSHYFENLHRRSSLEPEKKLMFAVLEDAIRCFQDNVTAQSGTRRKLFEDAEEWILERDRQWLFSFENICDALGLNPTYVRRRLIARKPKRLLNNAGAGVWRARRLVV